MSHARGEGRDQGEREGTIHCVHPVAGFPPGDPAEKSRYDLARTEARAAVY